MRVALTEQPRHAEQLYSVGPRIVKERSHCVSSESRAEVTGQVNAHTREQVKRARRMVCARAEGEIGLCRQNSMRDTRARTPEAKTREQACHAHCSTLVTLAGDGLEPGRAGCGGQGAGRPWRVRSQRRGGPRACRGEPSGGIADIAEGRAINSGSFVLVAGLRCTKKIACPTCLGTRMPKRN